MNSIDERQNVEELIELIQGTIKSYSAKETHLSTEDWMIYEFRKHNLEIEENEIKTFNQQVEGTIELNSQNIESINSANNNGITKEKWVQQKIQEASVGRSINEVGQYLENIDQTLLNANNLMKELITNNDDSINRNVNLDGFIFEQHHANSFNLDVALKGGDFKAEALKPKSGETFKKNSVDLVIKDNNGNVVRKYQAKFSAKSINANRAFKKGNYKFQRKLVAKGQAENIKNSTEIIGIKKYKSSSLSKQEGKELQKLVQDGQQIEVDWNYYKLKEVTNHLTKNVAIAGLQSATITVGFDLVYKTITNKKIDIDDTVELALKSGVDSGVKTSVTVALKIASEKGLLKVIPPGTPPAILANIATISIENVKVLSKVANGEMTVTQGLQQMERVTIATTAGLLSTELGAMKGLMIGGMALSWIPIVGSPIGAVLGGIIGGTVGYIAGSTIGEKVCKTAQKVRSTAVKIVKAGGRAVKKGYNKAKNFVKSLF